MAVFTAVAAGIGAAAAIGSTVSGISSANKQRRSAQRDKDRAQREIDSLKKSRQSVVNPYAGVVDLSSMALAQAALQSKKGVAASIEQQEARNEEMKARGDQALQQQKISEQQRLQNISISEGQRVQTADAAGKQFVFQTQEDRTNADLDRASGQQTQARQSIADANAAKASAVSGGLGALGSIAGSVVAAGPDAFN